MWQKTSPPLPLPSPSPSPQRTLSWEMSSAGSPPSTSRLADGSEPVEQEIVDAVRFVDSYLSSDQCRAIYDAVSQNTLVDGAFVRVGKYLARGYAADDGARCTLRRDGLAILPDASTTLTYVFWNGCRNVVVRGPAAVPIGRRQEAVVSFENPSATSMAVVVDSRIDDHDGEDDVPLGEDVEALTPGEGGGHWRRSYGAEALKDALEGCTFYVSGEILWIKHGAVNIRFMLESPFTAAQVEDLRQRTAGNLAAA